MGLCKATNYFLRLCYVFATNMSVSEDIVIKRQRLMIRSLGEGTSWNGFRFVKVESSKVEIIICSRETWKVEMKRICKR